jgi:hypothetical protein
MVPEEYKASRSARSSPGVLAFFVDQKGVTKLHKKP